MECLSVISEPQQCGGPGPLGGGLLNHEIKKWYIRRCYHHERQGGELEVQLQPFLISALEGEWITSRTDRFIPQKTIPIFAEQTAGWLQSRYGGSGESKVISFQRPR